MSNNNAATENVYEKLEKYNLDYLCAKLGRKENKEEFIKNQTGKYPKFFEELKDKQIIENEVATLNKDIREIFKIQNEIAKLKEELGQIKTEHAYFNKHVGDDLNEMPKIRNINRLTVENIMKLKVELEELEKADIWLRIKSQFLYGVGNRKFYKKNKKEILKYFDKLFFIIKEIELDIRIKKIYYPISII